MSKETSARKALWELKSQYGTWNEIAVYLSQFSDAPISNTAVWKMALGKTRSVRILKALGLVRKRYRRTADFKNAERLKEWDTYIKENNTSLTLLCNGLLDGSIRIIENKDSGN